jgi:16S rRNA (guanine527-N7)-methyltransferase
VFGGRVETLATEFDCVTLRAVDRMERAVEAGTKLVRLGGWLAMMTTGSDLARLQAAAGGGFVWRASVALPGGEDRMLALGRREQAA